MRIALLGAVCFDEIFPVEGDRREGFGGTLYNAAALSSVLEDGDWAVPISRLGQDRYEAALAEFARLPHVDTSGLTMCAEPFTHVTLTWRTASWRDEIVRHRMPPYDDKTLEKALDCDAAHMNFINGTEIDLETLRAFRKRFRGLLSLDVHNIISRFDAEGKRTIVGFRQWREWAPHLDVVQCNEHEINTMFDRDLKTRADFVAGAKEVCAAGPRAVTVTLGPEGAVTVHRRGDAHFVVDIDVLPPVKALDATGCGDSFSAGFLLGMLRVRAETREHENDPATALACGSVVAGVNARHAGIGQLTEAKDYLEDPRAHFAVFNGKPADWPGERV